MSGICRIGVFAVLGLAALGSPALGQPISGAEDGWAAIGHCAALANDAARHACADDVMRRARLFPTAEARAAERRKSFGAQGPAAHAPAAPKPVAAAKPERPRAEAAAPAPRPAKAEAAPVEDANHIAVTLTRVEQAGDGRLLMTTSEGAVWTQVESDPIRPPPAQGQAMVIQRTSFGGFMCKPEGRAPFRCRRR